MYLISFYDFLWIFEGSPFSRIVLESLHFNNFFKEQVILYANSVHLSNTWLQRRNQNDKGPILFGCFHLAGEFMIMLVELRN